MRAIFIGKIYHSRGNFGDVHYGQTGTVLVSAKEGGTVDFLPDGTQSYWNICSIKKRDIYFPKY